MGKIFDKLRIQGRMLIFGKISQKALNRILTLPGYRFRPELLFSFSVFYAQTENNIMVAKQSLFRNSVRIVVGRIHKYLRT